MLAKRTSFVEAWLSISAFLVFLMVVVGGYTRLSGSGLSITYWKPISGIFWPDSMESWENEFNFYKNSPEYKQVNKNISLKEFQYIFLIEFVHRMLGRAVFIVFFMPLIYMSIRKTLPKFYISPWLVAAMIIIQGFLGWYMVSSGLVKNPHVSHFRLALHLIMAFVIFSFMISNLSSKAIDKFRDLSEAKKLKKNHLLLLIIGTVQIIYGAFVSGLKAGLIYNQFPLMGNNVFPAEFFDMRPLYINFLHNHATVQFAHRLFAFFFVILLVYVLKQSVRSQISWLINSYQKILGITFLQILIGILTLVNHIPIFLAIIHQSVALLLFAELVRSWVSILQAARKTELQNKHVT